MTIKTNLLLVVRGESVCSPLFHTPLPVYTPHFLFRNTEQTASINTGLRNLRMSIKWRKRTNTRPQNHLYMATLTHTDEKIFFSLSPISLSLSLPPPSPSLSLSLFIVRWLHHISASLFKDSSMTEPPPMLSVYI